MNMSSLRRWFSPRRCTSVVTKRITCKILIGHAIFLQTGFMQAVRKVQIYPAAVKLMRSPQNTQEHKQKRFLLFIRKIASAHASDRMHFAVR